jgi:hypothetical protein
MRYASVIFATALAGVFANASAKADVFGFSFTPQAAGTFTTGAPATDPGYELITGLTFDALSGSTESGVQFAFNDVVAKDFRPEAAFNPTTGAFINHADGKTSNNIGLFFLSTEEGLVSIDGPSFSQVSVHLIGTILSAQGSSDPFDINGPLRITPKAGTPVPEVSTWAMMLLGFAWLGFAG